ncbi:hypothetical protein LBMAG42_51590 [Deltaproteobacteria bacterium]|nr:hypothetical protein LBMAG42_51590 [Deltaproteobacteria bacterium]
MSRMNVGSLVLLFACTDYDLNQQEKPGPGADADTGEFVPAEDTSVDTADTGDSGLVIDEDTGEPDPEVATESVYINSGSTLYGYDPTTNTATTIGVFKDGGVTVSDMTDIAIDLSGHMYGIAYTEVYQINPTTAVVTDLGAIRDNCNALTFVSDGTLVAACDSGVITIDTTTLKSNKLGGTAYTSSGDIIGLPDGMLYWSVQGGASDDLVQVNPTNGQSTLLGSIGTSGVYALGYANGALYGFTSANKVIVIDSTTGRTTSTDKLSGTWWGATTNPVLW